MACLWIKTMLWKTFEIFWGLIFFLNIIKEYIFFCIFRVLTFNITRRYVGQLQAPEECFGKGFFVPCNKKGIDILFSQFMDSNLNQKKNPVKPCCNYIFDRMILYLLLFLTPRPPQKNVLTPSKDSVSPVCRIFSL